jgi:hypothetical protein
MKTLYRLLRRYVIHRQLRSLEGQADSIVQARQSSLTRLREIERDRVSKQAMLRRYARQFN